MSLMKEVLFEDDYYPPSEEDHSIPIKDVEEFVKEFTDNQIGIPPAKFSVYDHASRGRQISIQVPKSKGRELSVEQTKNAKREWSEMAADLIDEIHSKEWGDYEIDILRTWGFTIEPK